MFLKILVIQNLLEIETKIKGEIYKILKVHLQHSLIHLSLLCAGRKKEKYSVCLQKTHLTPEYLYTGSR